MNLSITAVTRNRAFSKALSRVLGQLTLVDELLRDIETADESFDILQLVFIDRNPNHVKVIGTKKGDRLFQVEVGIPPAEALNDRTLKHELASRIEVALSLSPMPEDKRTGVLSRLAELGL